MIISRQAWIVVADGGRANVAKLVVSEIGKDYTHMAINELQKTLMSIH